MFSYENLLQLTLYDSKFENTIFLDKIFFFIAKTIIHFVLRKYVDLLYLEIDLTRNIAYTKDYASIVYSD